MLIFFQGWIYPIMPDVNNQNAIIQNAVLKCRDFTKG